MQTLTVDSPATLTQASANLFTAYFRDAANWSGTPLVGGNVGGTKEQRGNLTQLKKAGLVKTWIDEGHTWLEFTPQGIEYALSLGLAKNW